MRWEPSDTALTPPRVKRWGSSGLPESVIRRLAGLCRVFVPSVLANHSPTLGLAAEVIVKHDLPARLSWIEHYPDHYGRPDEYSLVRFSSGQREEVCIGGVWRYRIGSPTWSPQLPEEVEALTQQANRRLHPSHAGAMKDCFLLQALYHSAAMSRARTMPRITNSTSQTRVRLRASGGAARPLPLRRYVPILAAQ